MRCWGWMVLAVGVSALGASSATAGIYNPGESEEGATPALFMDSGTGRDFRTVLFNLRSIALPRPPADNPVRRRYIFEEGLLTGNAKLPTTADRLQASAVLLRRRKFKEAELLLRPVATRPEEKDNLPLQSNFATALHLTGNLQDAMFTLRPVVNRYWSTPWDQLPEARRELYTSLGWSEPEYQLYHEYDRYYLKLLQLRLREKLQKKAGKSVVEPPDALFDDAKGPVRFVGESGEFEAGKLAAVERAKLPRDALPVVQKLLVWLPDDLRLYWLLAELYNVQDSPTDKQNEAGIRAAHQIFLELSRYEPLSDEVREQLKRRIGVLGTAVEGFDRDREKTLDVGLRNIEKTDVSAGPFDWRTAGISFGFGFVVAIFVVWQVREIQRRRQVRLASQKARLTS